MARLLLLLPLLLLPRCSGSMYDVTVDAATPPAECALGCAPWANVAAAHNSAPQSSVDALWASRAAQANAGAACAMPAAFAGQPEELRATAVVGADAALGFDFSYGSQCYCAGTAAAPTSAWGYCRDPAVPTPQQVNVVFGVDETELIVQFVTVDGGAAVGVPTAELCSGAGAPVCANATGTTVRAPEPQAPERVLSYHVVVLPAVASGGTYTYRVHSGVVGGVWSRAYALRPRPAAGVGPTILGVVGDLGVYPYNCFANLLADTSLHAFIHLGDHAYNMEMGKGERGDAYMLGFEPVLSGLPWLPVYGNHELEGSPFGAYCPPEQYCQGRYMNQTRGLSRAAASSRSNSTLYYSIDIGLAHIVVLDYMEYIGLDKEAAAQLIWLDSDLARAAAAAQRARVPWILVAAHVPMYDSTDGNNADVIREIEPLLFKYGVDVHMVGHSHYYESAWPTGPSGAVPAKSFVKPAAPVHVITGAGGAPAFGAAHGSSAAAAAATAPPPSGGAAATHSARVHIERWSWSRLVMHNASALTWQQWDNINGSLLDEFTIVQPNHGPFPQAV